MVMSWISVHERLPNEFDEVLLFGKLTRISLCSVFVGYLVGDGEWKAIGQGTVADVRWWQPMLKGPEEAAKAAE
jgi:hypothetical protein